MGNQYNAGASPTAPQGGTFTGTPDMRGGQAFASPATGNPAPATRGLPLPGEAPPSGIPAGPRYPGAPTAPHWQGGPPRGPRRHGPGAAIIAVSAGAALLVGGTIKLLDAGGTIRLGDATNTVVWASGAAVLGLGILVAGLRGRTSGLLGFLAVVALVIGGIFGVVPRGDRLPLQNAQWTPLTTTDAHNGYDITGANGVVDLTQMELGEPLKSGLTVPLNITASNIRVLIPETVPVEIKADMTFGNLKGPGNATGNRSDGVEVYNSDKPGASLVVEVHGTFSNITIQEGN